MPHQVCDVSHGRSFVRDGELEGDETEQDEDADRQPLTGGVHGHSERGERGSAHQELQ